MTGEALDRLLAVDQGVGLCWLGNLGWLLRAEARLIAFDLDLHLDLRLQPSPVPAEALAPHLDAHLITHEHGDHFNAATCRVLVERSDCAFVVPASCLSKARDLRIPDNRLHVVEPRQRLSVRGVAVETLRALHGDRHGAVYRHANLQDCGYLVALAGRRLLQPGDTVLLQDHLELRDVDVLFVSPTEHNLHVERAHVLVDALRPGWVFPQHFGTYVERDDNRFWTRGYVDELRQALTPEMRARYHELGQGEVFVVEAICG